MFKLFKHIAAVFMITVFIACSIHVTSIEAAVPTPKNARFVQYRNISFDDYTVAWNLVPGADCYQLRFTWTDGSHQILKTTRNGKVHSFSLNKQNNTHVYIFRVRAKKGKQYSAWSNPVFITPSPKYIRLSMENPKSSKNYVKVRWNIIYGSSGYNVFLTTNPTGKWYWNSSTSQKATATNATIKSFRGSKLKRYTNYYLRIISRRKRNGVFCTVPMPWSDFHQAKFMIFPGTVNAEYY